MNTNRIEKETFPLTNPYKDLPQLPEQIKTGQEKRRERRAKARKSQKQSNKR